MQYKIPIQIENEDPIVFGLSLRQLAIIFIWWSIWYGNFSSLQPYAWTSAAAFPAILIAILWIAIAVFKFSEMTFMVFLLNSLRYWVNYKERYWQKWIDSFSALDIWYVVNVVNKTKKVDLSSKEEKLQNLEEKLKKI